MQNKQALGQFFTTNYEYILQNLCIPDEYRHVIEPFAGNCDLVKFIKTHDKIIELYDIEPQNNNVIMRDTIKNPPSYKNKFVLTNPPYLARNKNKNKELYDKYEVNDLYKCFISELLSNSPSGGILIIPLNFWSSTRENDTRLRELFIRKFDIQHLNIFEEQVFNDTSATVCSFQFRLKEADDGINPIRVSIIPAHKKFDIKLNQKNNFTIGGSIYNLPVLNTYSITRLTRKNKNSLGITKIRAKCIDDNHDSRIRLEKSDDLYIDETPNLSCRTYASLVILPEISEEIQLELIEKFNEFLNKKRDKYHSLFLPNYRESKDIARKRISFELVYQISHYLLERFIKPMNE